MPLRPLVVLSHLRWDFVYQRPQHVLSRLAATRPVFVIEEPVHSEGEPHWERQRPASGVTVLRPHTPLHEGGFTDGQLQAMRPLVDELAREVGACDVWVYTPLAVSLIDALDAQTVVYDCMDELSAFDHAPPQLLEREQLLLDRADLVFTGGPSLYRAKKDRHADVHCFTSSVDAAHFGQARPEAPALDEPEDQRALPHPRLGFFGVIDERLDANLVGALAEAHPEWQIVMVGPVVKIDPATLPQAANIHWLGGRTYDELPPYLAGWDVCLLPFARNRSTEFISPTKTLEYMAAERPIVSTPITDVAEPYGDIVYLGDTPEAFIQACEAALKASPKQREANVADMRAVLAKTSWDTTARRMAVLLDGTSCGAASGDAPDASSSHPAAALTPEASGAAR
ncbi:glycosyltransferase [Rubricoccus marinus]|uniref:glycosyltransferase n=1 Tax=Rubricoccus marinus TaxID=716817 RepID=UPI001C52778B|nr:glycosyltransferase [Rubricoccus marinus]